MTHTRKCSGCGREISAYASRCMFCGKARPVRCAKCKKFIYDGSTQCTHCGAPLPDPARTALAPDAKRPAYQWKVDKDHPPSPAQGEPVASTPAPSRSILVIIASVIVILFAVHIASVFMKTNVKGRGTKEVHELWDKARELAKQGKADAARETYNAAIAAMQYHSLADPALRDALERELAELSPHRGKEPETLKPVAPPDPSVGLRKKGYTIHGPLAFFAKPPGKGFYLGHLCVEIWIEVLNIGDKPTTISRPAFKAHFDDGSVLPPADVYEAYHLREKELKPGESTSGALLFGARVENAVKTENLKEVTYEDKTIWKRDAAQDKP